MSETYDVWFGKEAIGTAAVERRGLYYRFFCRCRLTGQGMYKLVVSCGDNRESLGVLAPADGCFGLETQLPVKKLGEGEMRFQVLPKHGEVRGKFVPLSPTEPFAYLTRLENAYLERRNGELGIAFHAGTGDG